MAQGKTQVEDVTARLCQVEDVAGVLAAGEIPVLVDPEAAAISVAEARVVVDAILAKKKSGHGHYRRAGGHRRGTWVHRRGGLPRRGGDHARHTLGRVIWNGSALPNTNIPGLIGGFAGERVLRAPADGIFHPVLEIGALVKAGDVAGYVGEKAMVCTIRRRAAGYSATGHAGSQGMKSGDVDPRGCVENCTTASDKALAIGGGVLEAILQKTGVLR